MFRGSPYFRRSHPTSCRDGCSVLSFAWRERRGAVSSSPAMQPLATLDCARHRITQRAIACWSPGDWPIKLHHSHDRRDTDPEGRVWTNTDRPKSREYIIFVLQVLRKPSSGLKWPLDDGGLHDRHPANVANSTWRVHNQYKLDLTDSRHYQTGACVHVHRSLCSGLGALNDNLVT